MAKKPNYSFEKNMKEQKRAKKREEKRLRRLENSQGAPDGVPLADADDAPPDAMPVDDGR